MEVRQTRDLHWSTEIMLLPAAHGSSLGTAHSVPDS